jgi:tetratricopeptide (TPR) repeat protein
MKRRILVPSLIFLLVLAFAISSASASSSTSSLSPLNEPTLVPSNYCISCHLADDPRLATSTEWKGGIGREAISPCPAATKIHEELYYIERLLLMIDRGTDSVGALPEGTQTRLENYTQLYSRQLDEPVTSLHAFTAEAQTSRYRLNKIYTNLNAMAEGTKQRTILIYAGLITLIVLGSLAWGIYNTRSIRAAGKTKPKVLLGRAVFVLTVLVFFALPIFRVPVVEAVETTIDEQEAQAVLDTADRSATTTDRAQARAWMIARLGRVWNETDPMQAQAILKEALDSVQLVRENENALWGQSLSVQEAMVGVPIDMEKADLIAVDLNAARARSWSLPLIATEWNSIDPVRAAELLQAEQDSLESQVGIYRDLQLRGVALAWAEVKPSQAVPAASGISDVSIRSWTLREVAVITKDASVFDLAAEAAREVQDPVQRARALRGLAVASKNASLFDEALAALDNVSGASLAYALSDLAVASGDLSLVDRIDPAYPDARANALLRLGEYQDAWDAASAIVDPYEQARAQVTVASAWENADAALLIKVALYRDLALRNVIRKTGDVTLMDSIRSVYYKVQALTALGDYEKALQAVDGLSDSYPLVELISMAAKEDPQAALLLVEKMSRETDKAAALSVIAAVTKDQSIFEQAQGMALAARVQGDALAPSEVSLGLANLFWEVNAANARSALRQAYEAAQRILIK